MSLIAWLPLNGNLNNNGLSDFAITGTPNYVAGKVLPQGNYLGNKLTFTIPQLVGATTWSVAFWYIVNADDTLSTDWVDILGLRDQKSDNTTNGDFRFETCYGSQKNNVSIGVYDNGTYATCGYNSTLLNGTYKGTWHHIVTTVDLESGKVVTYLDGVSKYTSTHNGGHLTGYCWIGQNNAINGCIQDVRYYDHALSVKEVKELAKGLCMHLPLDWGGNPNMIKNSYTWMNKSVGSNNGATDGYTFTKSVYEDNSAPCKWVMRCQIQNETSQNPTAAGVFYGIALKGLATTDLTENEYYTYSFWAKSESGVASGLKSGPMVEGQTKISDSGYGALDSSWRYHTVTFQFTKTTSLTNCFYITAPANSTVDFELCGIKLEKGQKATPYIPHVEETVYADCNYGSIITEDCSGYGNNGTLGTGISCNSSTPRYSTSTAFTSTNGGITKIPSPLRDNATDLTISCWVYPAEVSSSKAVYNARTVAGAGIAVFLVNNPNTIRFDTGNTMTTFSYSFTANTWTHLVVTKTPTEKKLYINGELKQTVSANTTMANVAEKGSVGVSSGSNAGTSTSVNYFNGSMSDFRLYATALSADNIKELYQIPAQIDKTGKVYCNKFIEE